MYLYLKAGCFLILYLFLLNTVTAEVVTIEATIISINENKITIERKGKETEFDLSKNVDATSFKSGQTVNLKVHLDLEVVVKIEASKNEPTTKDPELVILQELDSEGNEGNPVLSPDGLRIYWHVKRASDQMRWVWTAKRKDQNSLFADKKRLLPAVDFTVSGDGLEMILLQKNGLLASAKRKDIESNFGRPRVISELNDKKYSHLVAPCLSADGLTLYGGRIVKGKGIQFHYSTRTSKNSRWSHPRLLPLPSSGYKMRFMTLSADEKYLFCNAIDFEEGKPNVLVYSRETTDAPFRFLGVVDSDELKIIAPKNGAFAQFLPESNELFFVGEVDDTGEKKLMLIKNFSPEKMVKQVGD